MKVLLEIEADKANSMFNVLRTLFRNSEFKVTLIEQKKESMSGKVVICSSIEIERISIGG